MARTKGLPAGFRRKKDKDGNETGRLEYRFTIGRDRYSVTGSTVGECRRLEQEKRDYIAEHSYIRNDRITVREYCEEWLRTKAGTVKESTIFYEGRQIKPVIDRIGDERIAALERRQIKMLQSSLAEKYTTEGVNHRMMLLKSMLNAALVDKIILSNPAANIKPLKRTEPLARDTIHRALTEEEQKLFFEAAAGEWFYELLCFLVMTGCRVGEACSLRWSDVDMKNSTIHIRRTIIHTERGEEIGKEPKSNSSKRDIPLTDGIRDILKRQRQKTEDMFGSRAFSLNGLIFVSIHNKVIKESSVRITINRVCRRTEIDRFGVHALRDTFATRAIEAGMSPQTLKTILGHSSFSMTMDLYAHVLPNTKAEEMNRIRNII